MDSPSTSSRSDGPPAQQTGVAGWWERVPCRAARHEEGSCFEQLITTLDCQTREDPQASQRVWRSGRRGVAPVREVLLTHAVVFALLLSPCHACLQTGEPVKRCVKMYQRMLKCPGR